MAAGKAGAAGTGRVVKKIRGGEMISLKRHKAKGNFFSRGRPKAVVDTDKILKLYIDKRLTLRQISRVVGVSHTTVAKRIAEQTGQLRSWRLPGEN